MMYTERKSPEVDGSDYLDRDIKPNEQLNDRSVGMRSPKINPGPCLYPYQLMILVGEGAVVTGSCEGLVNSSKHRGRSAVASPR